MPRRSNPLDPGGGPLQRMAIELRRLRDTAPAGRPTRIEEVADQKGVSTSRAAIYAAMSGKRLVTREALTAIVMAWAPGGLDDLALWTLRRRECEYELARGSEHASDVLPFGWNLMTHVSEPKSDLFRTEMTRLWTMAGRPPLRELARRAGHAVSYTTLHNALSGRNLPSLKTLQAFLVGVGADEETSRALLSELARITERGPFEWQDGKLIHMDS